MVKNKENYEITTKFLGTLAKGRLIGYRGMYSSDSDSDLLSGNDANGVDGHLRMLFILINK
jgi:hypothetical protein